MSIKYEKYVFWLISMIFVIGVLYANVLKIPALESKQQNLENRTIVIETNYTHIIESLGRIENKLK